MKQRASAGFGRMSLFGFTATETSLTSSQTDVPVRLISRRRIIPGEIFVELLPDSGRPGSSGST